MVGHFFHFMDVNHNNLFYFENDPKNTSDVHIPEVMHPDTTVDKEKQNSEC